MPKPIHLTGTCILTLVTPVTAPEMMHGATLRGSACSFRVWAPRARQVTLRLNDRDHPLRRGDGDVFTAALPARPGDRYAYVLDGGKPLPDPVSRLLPEGVHGPTEIVDAEAFRWNDQGWEGLPLRDFIIYELHVGTFTPQGNFDGVMQRLDYLTSLGITVLEIMPVAAFPGTRNWGYDGVSPYSVQASYGGPEGLKRLVDAAHRVGLAVMLDVVYNHLGNEGNYLAQFGPYFTPRHHTPWGDAVNFDGPDAAPVRRYFVENALYWVREYHLDGLRLDATQTIFDNSPNHIVQEIAESVHALGRELGRQVCVICETDENDRRYVLPRPEGFGVDAVWSDDFHHALHTLLTRESKGYYQDFGRGEQLARALEQGFAFQGEAFQFWGGKPRGTPAHGIPLLRHVIAAQNHDQVGNRALGERLTTLVPRGARKLAAALLLLAPETPLLFMGQEYDEEAPFQFFTDYGDPALQKAVREGRRKEFADFAWDEVPDPQDVRTFERSKLNWNADAKHTEMLQWYRQLIELRRALVIPGERTCSAQWQVRGPQRAPRAMVWKNATLTMQVPAREPRVMVTAAFPGGHPGSPARAARDGVEGLRDYLGWIESLRSDEDGYRVVVYTR